MEARKKTKRDKPQEGLEDGEQAELGELWQWKQSSKGARERRHQKRLDEGKVMQTWAHGTSDKHPGNG